MTVITGMKTGGAERVMATLCNELSKDNKIRLVCLKERESDYQLNDEVEFVSGNIRNRSFIKSVQFVNKQISEWNPDVILSFMNKSNIVSLCSGMLSRHHTPIVVAERANPYHTSISMKLMRRILYPRAEGAIFQTSQAQDYYKNILRCNSIVLRNPLNPCFNIDPYKGERRKTIVTMGRLSQEKNQKLLIESFASIAQKYPEYTVEIYGDGPMKQELQDCINNLKLENQVLLMGRKSNVLDYIQDASIFVLPSNSEGMPNALLEAMSLGLPCIATDCPIGGPAAIIKNMENGILIPMNDLEMLADSISILIDDGILAKKIGYKAQSVTEDYSAEKVCAEWEAYLKKIGKHTN